MSEKKHNDGRILAERIYVRHVHLRIPLLFFSLTNSPHERAQPSRSVLCSPVYVDSSPREFSSIFSLLIVVNWVDLIPSLRNRTSDRNILSILPSFIFRAFSRMIENLLYKIKRFSFVEQGKRKETVESLRKIDPSFYLSSGVSLASSSVTRLRESCYGIKCTG